MKFKGKLAVLIILVFAFSAFFNSFFILAINNTKRVDNIGDWTVNNGNLTQDDSGFVFSGNGSGLLIESFYQEPFSSVNGFNTTINLDALGSVSNTDFGFYLTSATSPSSTGLKLVFQPFAANSDINACWINPYLSGVYSAASNKYLEINKASGALNIALSRESDGVWHLFANGVDTGTDLSAIKTILDSGNLYFGIYAWSQNQNNYSIRFKQLFGDATGKASEFSEDNLTKSTKGNVSSNQTVIGTENGFTLNGSLTSAGCSFKYGFNKAFTILNGFNTTINATMDGVNGSNGAPNFNFGLSTTGSGINGERLDTWDYFGSAVTGARGIDIRFKNFGSYLSTNVFVLGTNGELNHPADFLSGNNIVVPADGNINISLITTNNGAISHWTILANGREIISNNPAVNAELDALSSMGAYPIYSANYDDIGSLGTAKAKLLIKNINGKMYETTQDTTDTTNVVTGTKPVLESDFVFSGINPAAKYLITNDGVKVSAMNGPGGFQSMMTYGTQLDASNLGVTLKLDTVFASTGQNPHHIDVLLGNKKDANFTEQKCVYIRLTTKGNTAQDGLNRTSGPKHYWFNRRS